LQLAYEPFGGGMSGFGPNKIDLQTGEAFVDKEVSNADSEN
jgi:hypothetical protein